jgi:8-oxo-dGTP pyrophosphatase MutT (NUDIX family)
VAAKASWLERLGIAMLVTGRAFLHPTASGVTALAQNAAGEVLLVRHSYRVGWCLPGGGVDPGEPPGDSVIRELREEVGLHNFAACELSGLYVRRVGIATNLTALYRIAGAAIAFKPNFEIRAVLWADPAAPPQDATPATLRRFAELRGAPPSPYW